MKRVTILLLTLILLLLAGCQNNDEQGNVGQTAGSQGVNDQTVSDPDKGTDQQPVVQPTAPVDDGKVPVWHMEAQVPVEGAALNLSYQYTYDENGAEIRRDIYVSGKLDRYFTFTYDEAGNELSRTCYNADGKEDWVYTYTYDEAGRETQWARYEDGELDCKSLYAYNENGDLAEEQTYIGEGDDRPSKTTCQYTYAEDGSITQYTTFTGFREGSTRKYTYHENGEVYQQEIWSNGVLNMVWTCNENGQPVSRERYSENDGVTTVDRREYTYDENGNMIERRFYENGTMTYCIRYTYTQIRVAQEKADIAIARQQTLLEEFW